MRLKTIELGFSFSETSQLAAYSISYLLYFNARAQSATLKKPEKV